MTYTKQVREYCENNKGTMIDISEVKDYPFSVVTMLEKRLNEKGISNNCRDIYCNIHGRIAIVI